MRDFTPVMLVGDRAHAADHRALGATLAKTWLRSPRRRKAKPDTLDLRHGRRRQSLAHLTMEVCCSRPPASKLIHVPYRGGGPLAIAATSGEVDMPTATVSALAQQVQQGVVRPLAITGTHRAATLPGTPTLTELGYAVQGEAFWGALAPAGTSAAAQAGYARRCARPWRCRR